MSIRNRMSVILIVFMAIVLAFAMTTPVSHAAAKPGKVKLTSVKSESYNEIELFWKAAKNAKKYEVFRATSKNGKYKRIKVTKVRIFYNRKLEMNQEYFYKVRAVNGKKKGAFSKVKSATPKLSRPWLWIESDLYTTILVSWNKVKGATGYELYRSSSDNRKYNLVGSFTDMEYLENDPELYKEYSYKVRAYRDVDGERYYSAYSVSSEIMLEIPSDVLSENIEVKETRLSDGDIVVEVINRNDVMVYLAMKTVLRDANGKRVGSLMDSLNYISPNRKYYYKIEVRDDNWKRI